MAQEVKFEETVNAVATEHVESLSIIKNLMEVIPIKEYLSCIMMKRLLKKQNSNDTSLTILP
jgi:hypothetical protein